VDPPGLFRRPPAAVIFDIGSVIVPVRPERVLQGMSAGGGLRDAAEIWAAIQRDRRCVDWQEGRMNSAEWHEYLTKQWKVEVGFDDFCASWNAALDPNTILGDDLFARLSAQCKLAALSNTDPLHCNRLDAHFSFLRHFPVRIYSCNAGARKPNPKIFQAVLQALDVRPAEALFIDDVPEYAHAARKIGMDAIAFKGPAELSAELARRGLAVD
jgi:putative hydrolase of the HAD superfamily